MKRYSNQKRIRRGYTLVELLVAVGISSTLVVGLPASIYVVSQSMNADNKTINRSSTAEVHAQLINDLKHATTFSELTNLAVTMKVPDRDNDSQPETIRYSWSGTAGDSLMYEYNGSTAIAVATNVHNFDLSYLTRLIEAPVIPDPIYIPDEGDEQEKTFGNTEEFNASAKNMEDMAIATKVTLSEEAQLQSITAYIDNGDKNRDYYFMIYSDTSGVPTQLLAMTEAGDEKNEGWRTLTVPATTLTAGTYWLGIGFTHKDQKYFYDNDDTAETHVSGFDADAVQIVNAWLGTALVHKQSVSIYGTYLPTSPSAPAPDSDEAASSKSSGWNWGALFGR